MKHIVITGANRGIGLELVRQARSKGYAVTAACRRPDTAEELLALRDEHRNLDVLPLELSDAHSIDRFVHELDGRAIDVFINNAGIYGQRDATLGNVDPEAWHRAFQVNTIAPLILTQKLLPQLRDGAGRRLAYLSSKMGSIADNTSGGSYVYRSTKSALNQVVRSLAEDLKPDGFIALALHPGWVRTDMGGPNGLIDTETSAAGLLSVIESATAGQSGQFLNYDGGVIEW
ncbi:MAG: SDR family oxidoreductase [Pseudohongiellaceae bacterium]